MARRRRVHYEEKHCRLSIETRLFTEVDSTANSSTADQVEYNTGRCPTNPNTGTDPARRQTQTFEHVGSAKKKNLRVRAISPTYNTHDRRLSMFEK